MPQATGLPFAAVPGLRASENATSVKLPGVQGLRVDVLAPGARLGSVVRVPELAWAAQAVPHYGYLLEASEPGAMLAGGHCIPVRLPQAARLVWHKLYSSTQRRGFREKAAKDQHQALVLAAVLAESDPLALRNAFSDAPQPWPRPSSRFTRHWRKGPGLARRSGRCWMSVCQPGKSASLRTRDNRMS